MFFKDSIIITINYNTVKKENIFELAIEGEESVDGKTVIVATGMKEKKIGAPGEEKFYGNGVSYCAICDGVLFRGRPTVRRLIAKYEYLASQTVKTADHLSAKKHKTPSQIAQYETPFP